MPTKTHAGVMHLFGEHFVRTGKVDKSYGKLYASLFALRQSGDYDDKYDSTREDVEPYFAKVQEYIDTLRNFTCLNSLFLSLHLFKFQLRCTD